MQVAELHLLETLQTSMETNASPVVSLYCDALTAEGVFFCQIKKALVIVTGSRLTCVGVYDVFIHIGVIYLLPV